jgi:hypothetical protein
MSQTKTTVQALRDIPLLRTMKEGEVREMPIEEARVLYALGAVKTYVEPVKTEPAKKRAANKEA